MAAAVYPPQVIATVGWRDVISAKAERRIVVRDRGQVVAVAGLFWRDASLDGKAVHIGGLGGVMTQPHLRGQEFGTAAVSAAISALANRQASLFGVPFCEAANVGFYRRLGWTCFDGDVVVEQPAGPRSYRIMQTMMAPLAASPPKAGLLDLRGLPW